MTTIEKKESKPESLPENSNGFTINASPFNQVKLELGAIIIVGIILAVSVLFVISSNALQLVLLGGYGIGAMTWLVFRVKQVTSRIQQESRRDE